MEDPKNYYKSVDLTNFKDEFFPEEKYIVKEFTVETEDGYILRLFRIQNHQEHKGVTSLSNFLNSD